MNAKSTKLQRILRKRRVRATVKGSAARPRLCVSISLNHISAQIIDDDKSATITAVTTVGKDIKGSMTDKAVYVGKEIAHKALKLKVKKVVFDRNHKLYHGRVKALADSARQEGLEF
jgi:large subunit ribosomal protein L18